jgi:hypothetical protein
VSAALRAVLIGIRQQHGNTLTPEIVVEVARDPEHPLHSRFEWDDSVAAEAYRREQAHELIRTAKVVYERADESGPPRLTRAFVAIPTADGHVYDPVEEVAEDPIRRQIALNDMERAWKDLFRRYKEFEEFTAMIHRDLGEAA